MSGNASFLVMLAAIVALIVLQLFRGSLKNKANEWGQEQGGGVRRETNPGGDRRQELPVGRRRLS